ncbi:hypothetical protein RN001_003364 [Aquatica leii]|uniref:Peptidase S1 domain-containing protein n=1 Tax=Aquatica leii TaxID=1421715 RepID=A0AAN7PIG9_9COLE|nr:hypothetical protein RN001_003364 [Aquatica leii]
MFHLLLRSLQKRALLNKFKTQICCYSNDANIVQSPHANIQIPNATVPEFLFDNFKHPHKIAVECAITGRNYTFEQLRRKTINLGHNLRAVLKLRKGDVVAVLLPNTPEFAIAILGIMSGSLIVTTVNPLNKPEEIRRQLSDCKAKAIITTCSLFPLACASVPSPHNTHIFTIKSEYYDRTPVGSINFHEFTESKINVALNNDSKYDEVVFMPYSSGTTSLPKGLQHTHYSLIANICQLNAPDVKVLQTTTDTHQDVVPAVVQLSHMYGFGVLLLNSLFNMSKIVTVPKFKPDVFVNVLNKYNPTILVAVPPILLFMTDHESVKQKHFHSIRAVLTAAAPLTSSNENRFLLKAQKQIQFCLAYGTSETGLITMNMNQNKYPGSVGTSLANSSIKVVSVDDLSKSLPSYSNGHLLFKGPQVMKGYSKQETDETVFTSDGWLKTGDLVYYDNNNNVYIVDRLKELIKVKGYQVAPAELEEVIRSYPNVEDAAVIGIPHNLYGEVPRAYITVKARSKLNVKNIEDYVAEKLSSYKSIKGGIVIVDNLPKNASVSLSILLSLCVGLILPPNVVHKNNVNYSLLNYCVCNSIQKHRRLNCMPSTLEDNFKLPDKDAVEMPLMMYHPYLVSLSINAYNDDNREKRFACAGTIVSRSWILAGQDCIIEHNEWFELQVRAGSVFWSKGGTVHKIKKILHFYKRGPVCLRVYPRFSFNQYVNAVKLSKDLVWSVANSTYWNDANTKKNYPYDVSEWSKTPYRNDSENRGKLKDNVKCTNVTYLGSSLVVNETLVAFQVGMCKNYTDQPVYIFINFQNVEYETWLTEIIKFGEPQHYGISLRTDEFVTNLYKKV